MGLLLLARRRGVGAVVEAGEAGRAVEPKGLLVSRHEALADAVVPARRHRLGSDAVLRGDEGGPGFEVQVRSGREAGRPARTERVDASSDDVADLDLDQVRSVEVDVVCVGAVAVRDVDDVGEEVLGHADRRVGALFGVLRDDAPDDAVARRIDGLAQVAVHVQRVDALMRERPVVPLAHADRLARQRRRERRLVVRSKRVAVVGSAELEREPAGRRHDGRRPGRDDHQHRAARLARPRVALQLGGVAPAERSARRRRRRQRRAQRHVQRARRRHCRAALGRGDGHRHLTVVLVDERRDLF
mmetsp:Transcript_19401/g.61017  ORF Transcript_19401/g.61017 Transcript_19401/m.61017 type:complete len:301 (-) Transcript_19401:215-1117(-)